MKKYMLFILLSVLIFSVQAGASAGEVVDIDIKGLQRSNEDLVKRQLAFKEGEIHSEQSLNLSRKRLFNSDLFNPFSLKLDKNEQQENKYQITVNAVESGVFMIHPYEFAIRKTVGLLGEKFSQKIRNPQGNGISYNIAFDWSDDSYQEYGVEYVGEEGKIYNIDWRDFDRDLEFNNKNFKSDGNFYSFKMQTIPEVNISNYYSLKYQDNDYSSEGLEMEQHYWTAGYQIEYDNIWELSAGIKYSTDRKEDNDFNKITINVNRDFEIGNSSNLIFDIKAGRASSDTPFNYYFTGGGFSKNDGGIPIRGQEYETAGREYIKTTLEYHTELWRENWLGVIFIDHARFAEADNTLDPEWETDGGLGVIYQSFLGPIRFDIGFDNLDEEPVIGVGFGNSF